MYIYIIFNLMTMVYRPAASGGPNKGPVHFDVRDCAFRRRLIRYRTSGNLIPRTHTCRYRVRPSDMGATYCRQSVVAPESVTPRRSTARRVRRRTDIDTEKN